MLGSFLKGSSILVRWTCRNKPDSADSSFSCPPFSHMNAEGSETNLFSLNKTELKIINGKRAALLKITISSQPALYV